MLGKFLLLTAWCLIDGQLARTFLSKASGRLELLLEKLERI